MGRLFRQLLDELLEHAATMFIIFKLVEAGAGRREQHDIAGLRGARGDFDGAVERAGTFDSDAAGDLAFDFLRCGAD